MQSYQSMQSQQRSKAHIKLSAILTNSFIMCKIFFGGVRLTDIMGAKCFVSGMGTPETGWAKQKEEQS